MKYAFMTFSTTEMTFAETLAAAKRFGYDGVEIRIDSKHKHGIEIDTTAAQRAAFKAEAAAAGIEMACLATSIKYADPSTSAEARAQTLERIDLAADIGAPVMRVFGGQFPESIGRAQAADLIVESLEAVAEHAARRGVAVCIETHDAWTDPRQVADILRRVDHPFIACNWDVMHPVRTKMATMDEAFEALRPWIRHLHIHDGAGDSHLELRPIGAGIYDHRRVLQLLKSIRFQGYLSGEWIKWSDPWDVHLPREIETLRRLEREIE